MASLSLPQQGRMQARERSKCSKCREKKVKCKPSNRDWDNLQQRCEYCSQRGHPCGPNYTSREDQERIDEDFLAEIATQWRGEASSTTQGPSNAIGAALEISDNISNGQLLFSDDSRADDLRNGIDNLSLVDHKEKGRQNIQVLHVLCRTFESTFAPASRQETYHPGNFDVMKIMDKIDSVFMSLYSIILYMDRREETDLECMLYKLHTVLLNFPCLWGTQRCGPLLKVAKIFKKLGCLFEYQDILKKLSTIPSSFDHPPDGEVCQFLAASLPYTTDFANQVLADCWRKTTMEHALPPDLEVSCLHRAAQFENGGIMSAILDSQLALDPYPGAYNQQYLSVSNWLSSFGSSQCVQARIGIDSRDITRQTPLFIAAACGSEQACLALITGLADPNLRNDQGHTILEVAARGGHLNIVRQLLSIGAELNPQLHRATSSPLQAAIESDNYNVELVRHLLDEGADIDIRRDTDFKNAIDIASDKGYKDLADSMRSLLTSAQPQPPMTDQPIDQDPY